MKASLQSIQPLGKYGKFTCELRASFVSYIEALYLYHKSSCMSGCSRKELGHKGVQR